MTPIQFRCERCGKMLDVQQDAAGTACPHCGLKIEVPTVIKVLATPKLHAPAGAASARAFVPVQVEVDDDGNATVGTIAKVMPWVMSVFFHMGLALVLMFAAILVPNAPAVVIGMEPPGPVDFTGIEQQKIGGVSNAKFSDTPSQFPGGRETAVRTAPIDSVKTTKTPIGVGKLPVGSSSSDHVGLPGPSGPVGPTIGDIFSRKATHGYHGVFVIDRSGSMMGTFDFVRRELKNTIFKMRTDQDFHVIFFAAGEPVENPPKALVPAISEYQQLTFEFMERVKPEGQTNPLPALKRAFDVLDQSDPKKPGRIIYLLTDGVFPDNTAVLKLIKERNAKTHATIVTYLYDSGSPQAASVLKQIADENKGDFRQVSSQE